MTLTVPDGFPAPGEQTVSRKLLDSIVARAAAPPPCVRRLDLPHCDRWAEGWVETDFTIDEAFVYQAGVVFGGYTAALIDQYAGLVMLTVLPDGRDFRTTELSVGFEARLAPGPARIEAEIIDLTAKRGICVVRVLQDGVVRGRGEVTQILR